jgi:hypothetical protein
MKTRKSLIGLFLITAICYFIISCKSDSYSSFSYAVYVDSVHVPGPITANTPFEVDVFGTVGNTTCCSFEGYNKNVVGNIIYVETIARYDDKDRTCQDNVSYIEDNLELTITSAGTYYLEFLRPNNYSFEVPITVN